MFIFGALKIGAAKKSVRLGRCQDRTLFCYAVFMFSAAKMGLPSVIIDQRCHLTCQLGKYQVRQIRCVMIKIIRIPF